jgi:hypothetical protein
MQCLFQAVVFVFHFISPERCRVKNSIIVPLLHECFSLSYTTTCSQPLDRPLRHETKFPKIVPRLAVFRRIRKAGGCCDRQEKHHAVVGKGTRHILEFVDTDRIRY